MKKKPPSISDEDMALFRDAVGEVKPVSAGHIELKKTPPKPIPRQLYADEERVLEELDHIDPYLCQMESGEFLSWRREGVQEAVVRKLKRGFYAVQAELDLHGFTLKEAHKETTAFLIHCTNKEYRCIRLIHGRSRHTAEEAPKIRNMLDGWLRHRKEILAFCSAKPEDGGAGAMVVLLRKPRY